MFMGQVFMCQAPHQAMGHTGRSDSPLSKDLITCLRRQRLENRKA